MPKLKKRADGRYRGSVVFDGKRYYIYAYSPKELEEKKKQKLKELEENRLGHDNPYLDKYYDAWTDLRRNKVKESTLLNQSRWYKKCADVVLPSCDKRLGDMRIQDIKPSDVKQVQLALIHADVSSSTVNDYMNHLSHVFASAVRDETISRNPCRCIEQISRKEPPARETKHRALTAEETEKFFGHAVNSYYYHFYRMMIQTGMRVGELGALYPKDIDAKNNCIHITKTITRDEIGGYIVGSTPKTKSGCRDIPLNDTIRQIVAEQKKQNRMLFGSQINAVIFSDPSGRLLREYSINREIKRICAAAGIDPFSCHAFRATFATRFIEQRPQDYKILAEILGHASTKITLDLYTHVMKEGKEKAMESLEIAM